MVIENYKEVTYKELQKAIKPIWEGFKNEGASEVKLANDLKVKTTQTVKNCFMPIKQVVSDELLTGVANCLGIDVMVVWYKRKRKYYIGN